MGNKYRLFWIIGLVLLFTASCSSSTLAQERNVNRVIAQQQSLVDERKYQAAVEAYLLALERYPNNERLLYNVGYLYLALSEYEQAQAIFAHLIRLKADDTQALLASASAFDLAGNAAGAQQQWAKIVELEPEQIELAYRLIESLQESGQLDAAIEVARGLYDQGHYNARLFTLLSDLAELREAGSGAAWAALAELYP